MNGLFTKVWEVLKNNNTPRGQQCKSSKFLRGKCIEEWLLQLFMLLFLFLKREGMVLLSYSIRRRAAGKKLQSQQECSRCQSHSLAWRDLEMACISTPISLWSNPRISWQEDKRAWVNTPQSFPSRGIEQGGESGGEMWSGKPEYQIMHKSVGTSTLLKPPQVKQH